MLIDISINFLFDEFFHSSIIRRKSCPVRKDYLVPELAFSFIPHVPGIEDNINKDIIPLLTMTGSENDKCKIDKIAEIEAVFVDKYSAKWRISWRSIASLPELSGYLCHSADKNILIIQNSLFDELIIERLKDSILSIDDYGCVVIQKQNQKLEKP